MRLPILSSLVVAAAAGITLSAASARAQDDTNKPSTEVKADPAGFQPLIGASVGFVDGSHRLGFSGDVAIDLLVRKSFGAVAFVTGLRPHYERFGLGRSDDTSCAGSTSGPCAAGSALYLSHTAANAVSLEVPLVAELRASRKSKFVPFVGVAPWLVHLRANERARAILPEGPTVNTASADTFFALNTFVGLSIYTSQTTALVLRAGWRFAPTLDLPGGKASVAGESVSVGYRVEL